MDKLRAFSAGEAAAPDPVLHEYLLQPWGLHHQVKKAGAFDYRIRYLKTPHVTLYWERFALACSLVGSSPAGRLVFCLPVHGRGQYWGANLEEDRIPVMSPGILHVELPESCEQIVLLVDRDYLLCRVAEEYRSRFLELISRRSVQAPTTSITSLQARACRLLHQCIKLDEITGAAVDQAEAMVLGLIDAVSMKDIAATPPLSQRRKGFERAMDILMQANLSGLDVPRLARAAAVSQRTLEYAFQDSLGMTPLEFFCRKRLHAARRELLESECNETTITEIALRNGFTHPSRFAQHYSRVFGEKPSDTLRQRRNTAGF